MGFLLCTTYVILQNKDEKIGKKRALKGGRQSQVTRENAWGSTQSKTIVAKKSKEKRLLSSESCSTAFLDKYRRGKTTDRQKGDHHSPKK